MKKNILIVFFILIYSYTYSYTILKKDFINYIDTLSLKQKIAQKFIVYASKDFNFIYEPGGIIPSIKILKQIYQNPQKYKKQLNKYKIPPIIAIDQEGGKVNRLKFIEEFPSMNELSHIDRKKAKNIIIQQINLMKKLYINLNLSPVVDMPLITAANIRRMKRNIASQPDSIIDFAIFYINIHKKNGIMNCIKHYPGYGNTLYNSDVSLFDYYGSILDLIIQMNIFNKLFKYSDFVMVSNLIYPFIDSLSASLSKNIIKNINIIDSSIIIITDDIACKAYKNPFIALKYAYNANNDMFVLMNDTLFPQMVDSLTRWIIQKKINKDILNNSIKKIILKKEKLFRIISNQNNF